jgi:hypothetical protein
VRAVAALAAAASLLSACASVPPPPPSRTPTTAERDEVRRSVVRPYLDCMRTEAHKAGAGARAVETAELACGHLIQTLRRYGASKDYDALQWSGVVEQVQQQGRAAAQAAR